MREGRWNGIPEARVSGAVHRHTNCIIHWIAITSTRADVKMEVVRRICMYELRGG